MFSIFKHVFRIGVIGVLATGVVGGAALMVAGPERTKAVIDQVHGDIVASIDEAIDDPVALRSQLVELEREYPKRIGQVRGDLAELNEQIRQLERDRDVAERVVAMAREDVARYEPALAEAAANRARGAEPRANLVSFGDHVLSYDRAQAKFNQIQGTLVAYTNRAADAAHDLTYLGQQSTRLEDLLVQLETERAQFQSQIAQLSRQVDAIARNERLIHLLEKRNKTIEQCSRFEVVSIDHLTGRLAEIRSRQEAELDHLANATEQSDYEELARMQLRTEQLEQNLHGEEGVDAPATPSSYEVTAFGH